MRTDLARLQSVYGCTTVVSLLPRRESDVLGIKEEHVVARELGLNFIRFSIVNGKVPKSLDAFARLIADLCARFLSKERIIVHCRGGFGRAGTVVVAMLMYLRVPGANTASSAIDFVREKRPSKRTRAVENAQQEQFLADYEVHLRSKELVDPNNE